MASVSRDWNKAVLVVEDDDGIREVLGLALQLEGYQVFTAGNGKEALEALANIKPPCLILLDLMMPVMDGWAFAENLSQDRTRVAIPIVVVTAFARRLGTLKGARGVIEKPIDVDNLLRVVKELCPPNSR